jgi:hypothetical protein
MLRHPGSLERLSRGVPAVWIESLRVLLGWWTISSGSSL